MADLFLVRHGQSTWNKTGRWTGLTNVPLSAKGKAEARKAGRVLAGIDIHHAHVSNLKRAQETLLHIQRETQKVFVVFKTDALNEKDYGIYTGKNKWQIKKELGDKEFLRIRRSWDYRIPKGESLRDVYERVVPYFKTHILPQLKKGRNILIVAHMNSLRALAKKIEDIDETNICNLEIKSGEIHHYTCSADGTFKEKRII